MKPVSPAVQALRDAGYQRLPPLWVTQAQMDVIIAMAKENEEDVNEIRAKARRKAEIDAAWRMAKG
jgi:protein-tyrosine-phosphatase